MNSRGREYFEALYAANPDPWNFVTSAYEHDKYSATMDVLEGRCFRSGFEIGCSIGVLTESLGLCCDLLLAVDIVQSALDAAAARCIALGHVAFQNMRVPEEWPHEKNFDLIVISEVLYFLDERDIQKVAACCSANVSQGGLVLLVNFTGKIEEPCGGNEAAQRFLGCAEGFTLVRHVRRERFRIDLLRRDA